MLARFTLGLALAALGAGLACGTGMLSSPADTEVAPAERARRAAAAVDDARLVAADADADDWLTHGRTYAEQRYSPLAQIDEDNVGQLGLAWWLDTDTNRGLEATPLVADGVLYATGSWSVVFAVDARSGTLLWTLRSAGAPRGRAQRLLRRREPRRRALPRPRLRRHARRPPGRARRGDGPRSTGRCRPSIPTQAVHDHRRAARREGQGDHRQRRRRARRARLRVGLRRRDRRARVALLHRARRSREAASSRPRSSGAAKTWTGEWWKIGGGGTVWDSLAYDPELDLLYVGTGNGSPWSRHARSPGGGDNLYLSLDPRAATRHRRAGLALPDDARRQLGLHRDAAHDPRRPRDRRRRRARC